MSTAVESASRPRMASYVRLVFDQVRERHMLLAPESVSVLNPTGAAVLGLCDGRRTVAEIVAELRGQSDHMACDEVLGFLSRLAAKRYVEVDDD
ncbi:pyrroloquinoline quinone biosynthesis peptide chaperone PqqD [Saccharopolyspora spinosa]|uniref:Pyrroloquinoline quinone biosynthesis protein D n=1 Tax=Saccharopolyspora spinosa TaxID=60894 RepID=A0A2N3XYS0_SACSN|nr:pyrroloquinoline quinone biosynthesis peptide chaperone PqqD [Saccharopolyspora spinosa]PKW15825.1 pyrroloquinoline quinone biosynthesis protein D [Saccharopolyspora spinosa]